jgi:hypothetical protein
MRVNNDKTNEEILQRYLERVKARDKAALQPPAGGEPAEGEEGEAGSEGKIALPFGSCLFMSKEMLDEFERRRKIEFPDVDALAELAYDVSTNEVTGSNSFIACYANTILPEGARTASEADLEKILKDGKLKLEGHYEDSSLVLRSNNEPNKYLANDLYARFKAKGVTLAEGVPYVIPLFGLKLVKDGNSPKKVSFGLTERLIDEKLYFQAPILNEPSQQSFEPGDIDETIGLPKRVGATGSRKLYTRNWSSYAIKDSGLSRLFLVRNLDVDADNEFLAYSGSAGRVVVVTGEAGGAP